MNLPRAALLANEIAEVAEFFSFGTNDLTQTTMGLSRDDAGRFLPDYVDEKKAGVFGGDPFQTLDLKGVGMLMRWGIEKGRETRPKLKVGICGEHGGDADSVKFCHEIGMDYVSASPFRVPISRLAAAQAVVEAKAKQKSAKGEAQVGANPPSVGAGLARLLGLKVCRADRRRRKAAPPRNKPSDFTLNVGAPTFMDCRGGFSPPSLVYGLRSGSKAA